MSGLFKVFDGDVASPLGFKASGIHAGIKKAKKDMALIVSDVVGVGAAVFTTNKACAAPVLVSKQNIRQGMIKAIVVNSGNANACTGQQGLENAWKVAEVTAAELGVEKGNIIVSSTGIIGVPMPMEAVLQGISQAARELSYDGGICAAEAIMTTDLCMKKIAVAVEIDGRTVTIGGIAKGSGMIHPNMATMLSFITTDIKIDRGFLQSCLKEINNKTYSMITVDGDTSTNDMVGVIANGMAGNEQMNDSHPDKERFIEAFYYINEYLAKAIARDGEGATKFLEAEVINAPTVEDAQMAIRSILGSSLVKTAFFGEDGNWGRILCSIGYSGADYDMDKIEIFLSSEAGMLQIVKDGQGVGASEEKMLEILKCRDIKITADFHKGESNSKGWGCDLSYDYVKINGAYRT